MKIKEKHEKFDQKFSEKSYEKLKETYWRWKADDLRRNNYEE